MDRGGQTVSATRFAQLTGVSRERLRTWERRYGFPVPRRVDGGSRRYPVADVDRVVAVRRAAEAGAPLPRAIADSAPAPGSGAVTFETLGAVPEHAPVPVAIVSGPRSLRVEYVNATMQVRPGALRTGDDLHAVAPWLAGSDAEDVLHELFTTATAAAECDHPAWHEPDATARSRLHRLPVAPGARPMVAIIGLDRVGAEAQRAKLARLSAEHERLTRSGERQRAWLETIAALAELFQTGVGDELLSATTDALVRQLRAVDAGVALHVGGELELRRSSRGVLTARAVTVTAYRNLAAAVRDGQPRWLTPAGRAAFGVPDELHVLAVPVRVVGETLGAAMLVLERREDLPADTRQVLVAISAAVGFAILRDRLVEASARATSDAPA